MNISLKHIVIGIILVALVILGVQRYLETQTAALASISTDSLRDQENRLAEIARALDNGSAVSVATAISDCEIAERYRFDELLSNLSILDRSELTELDSIFGSCAFYFATTRSVGVAALRREVDVYNDHLRVAALHDTDAAATLESLQEWHRLVELEQERSDLFANLTMVQADIVDRLLAYDSINSPAVQSLVARGQEVRQNVVFVDQQIDELRTTLIGS